MPQRKSLDQILPGRWHLQFSDTATDPTGQGIYHFKLAGTFQAEVADCYSGQVTWHGYWELIDARLHLQAQEVTPMCSSCLGGGIAHRWTLELEQMTDTVCSGLLQRDPEQPPIVAKFVRQTD
jgi:hypothetical protein